MKLSILFEDKKRCQSCGRYADESAEFCPTCAVRFPRLAKKIVAKPPAVQPSSQNPLEQAMSALENQLPMTELSKSDDGLKGVALMDGSKVGVLLDQTMDSFLHTPKLHLSIDKIDPTGRARRILNKNGIIDQIDDIPGWITQCLRDALGRLRLAQATMLKSRK